MSRNLVIGLVALVALALVAGISVAGPNAKSADPAVDVPEDMQTLVTRLRSKIYSSDTQDHDCFGRSLAMDGDYLVAGAKGEDDGGSDSGAAYVFKRIDGDWVQQTRLKASDAEPKDFFAFSVAINGGTIAVGAWQEDEKANGAGAAYVYERKGNDWLETAKLLPSDRQAFSEFGYDVSIHGNIVLVGAREDATIAKSAGAAYVFERRGGEWVETSKLLPAVGDSTYQFGTDVAAGENLLVIGALGGSMNNGSAYVYERQGGQWVQTSRIAAEDASADDNFGYSVATNGGTIVVGAYGNDASGIDAGAAYVFERQGSDWVQTARLIASDSANDRRLGWSIAINGERVVVGAWEDTAYLFTRGENGWQEEAKFLATVDPPTYNLFGFSVAVTDDVVAVGSRLDDDRAIEGGAVYFY